MILVEHIQSTGPVMLLAGTGTILSGRGVLVNDALTMLFGFSAQDAWRDTSALACSFKALNGFSLLQGVRLASSCHLQCHSNRGYGEH